MPKSKNRKKRTNNLPSRKPFSSYIAVTRHYFDAFVSVTHRILDMYGIEREAFDSLTKHTKESMMRIKFVSFKFIADVGTKIPKVYLKLFNNVLRQYEEFAYYDNPDYKIKYCDFVTYGYAFLYNIRCVDSLLLHDDQREKLTALRERVVPKIDDFESELKKINYCVRFCLMYVSSPNYRYYKSDVQTLGDDDKAQICNVVKLSSYEPEKKYFTINGDTRVAFRLWQFDFFSSFLSANPIEANIVEAILDTENIDEATSLIEKDVKCRFIPVYIQSHAINRMRQRLDCIENYLINLYLSMSFFAPNIVRCSNGTRLIPLIDAEGHPMGYFPFVRKGGAVLLLTFLPMASPITPEGALLQKKLGVAVEDTKYIGMDKLSFYVRTDFEKLPELKEALIEANMWHLTSVKTENPIEKKEDKFLQIFFSGITKNSVSPV